jgi:hypothetical protein
MLFPFRPHPHVAILFNLDVDHVRAATNRAILNVLLLCSGRQVDRKDDLFAAGIADIAASSLIAPPQT